MRNRTQGVRGDVRRAIGRFYPAPPPSAPTPWRISLHRADHDDDRWRRHGLAASSSYAARGLNELDECTQLDVERFPTWFAEATERDAGVSAGRPIGGLRISLPDAEGRLPIYDELAAHLDVAALERYVTGLGTPRVCQGGGLWIDAKYGQTALAGDVARVSAPILLLLEMTWCVSMTHTRVLDAWASLGWKAVSSLGVFAYPDPRYESSIVLGGPHSLPTRVHEWAARELRSWDGEDGRGEPFVRPMREAGE